MKTDTSIEKNRYSIPTIGTPECRVRRKELAKTHCGSREEVSRCKGWAGQVVSRLNLKDWFAKMLDQDGMELS